MLRGRIYQRLAAAATAFSPSRSLHTNSLCALSANSQRCRLMPLALPPVAAIDIVRSETWRDALPPRWPSGQCLSARVQHFVAKRHFGAYRRRAAWLSPAPLQARHASSAEAVQHHSRQDWPENPDPGRQPFQAVLLDAAGTLLIPSEPAAEVYLRYGRKYGVQLTEEEVLQRYRRAYNTPWGRSHIRYVGDGRPFWQYIVAESTGCSDPSMFEEIYEYYSRPEAWKVPPGAHEALARLKAAGIKLAVVSNFDTRLRPILSALHLGPTLFDAVVVSAEEGVEKPNPLLFEKACALLHVDPARTVHIGDDRRNDLMGARDAGCYAWLWGLDVTSYNQVASCVLHGIGYDWEEEEEEDDADDEDHGEGREEAAEA